MKLKYLYIVENNKFSYQAIIITISFSGVSGNVTDEKKGDVTCDGIRRTSVSTNTPGNSTDFLRTCRHMGMAQSSPICEICKIVSISTLLLNISSKQWIYI